MPDAVGRAVAFSWQISPGTECTTLTGSTNASLIDSDRCEAPRRLEDDYEVTTTALPLGILGPSHP